MHENNSSFNILKLLALFFLLSALSPDIIYAQRTKTSQRAGEQRKAEKGLKDNKYFLYFLDSTITNFGSEEEKKLFKEASQRDIISQLLYLKFLFKESFLEIRKIQKILIDLYRIALKRDIAGTKDLLNEIAPRVVLADDAKAIAYLRLGYRDQRIAEIFLKMADNYKETLYSLRLYEYVRAIKSAKHGRRYALLAMIESHIPYEEKGMVNYSGFIELKEKIKKYSPQEKLNYYSLIHLDNYYLSKQEKSFYQTVWEKPDFHEIEDYQRYLDEAE